MKFDKYCTPAQLYLVIAVISILAQFLVNFRFVTLLFQGLFVFIWTWILNWLCSKGFSALSWIIVLLPFALFLAAFTLSMDANTKVMNEMEVIEEEMDDEEDPEMKKVKEGMEIEPMRLI